MELRLVDTPHGTLAVRWTQGERPAVVCLHGFTLQGAMFTTLASLLPNEVLAPDLPGHGATTVEPVDLPTTLGTLHHWLSTPARPPVVLLGYSQGGRIAQHLAAAYPSRVAGLIVVSASPGLLGDARVTRASDDEHLAEHIESVGVSRFLDDWLEHPLVGTTNVDPDVRRADRMTRENNSAAGLAAALRGLGQGVLPPANLDLLTMPVAWVAGEKDDRYAALAGRMEREGHGAARIIPGSGHNVVLERPDELAALIESMVQTS
jgi:2-succinyl-6-hydroxy-2,4-cyclohexadiene-1-carboxylate synthase